MTSTTRKVMSCAEAADLADAARAARRRIVLTNGVFDLLHIGHLRYLQAARDLGDLLIVGVNSDDSTRALKGPNRPIVPQAERAELLAGFSCVDAVVIFPEPVASPLLEAVRPDIWVKGGDYGNLEAALRRLPEAPTAQRLGAEIRLLPFVEDRSTTVLIARVRESAGAAEQGGRGARA